MGFILKIYFIGLIAFVPGEQGEMTALMLDARDGYAVSDGSWIESHEPMLLVRSGSCSGSCRDQAQDIADVLFNHGKVSAPEESLRQLESALKGGGAWLLDGSQLILEAKTAEATPGTATPIPTKSSGALPTSLEDAGNLAWVAEIGRIDAESAVVDPDALAERPEKKLVAGRMTLPASRFATHRLVAFENRVVPLAFKPLRGAEPVTYSQALADWVVAEIPVEDCSARISAKSFDGKQTKVLNLAPERCDGQDVVELVLVNLPKSSFGPPQKKQAEPVGKHFEIFYELAKVRPPNHMRPVPVLAHETSAEKASYPLRQSTGSDFIRAIGLPWRGIYSRPICPVVRFQAGDTTG